MFNIEGAADLAKQFINYIVIATINWHQTADG